MQNRVSSTHATKVELPLVSPTPNQDLPGEPDPRSQRAYVAIADLLVRGQIAPGSRVIETDLVEHLSSDRKTVRNCLEKLEMEGLVRRLGGRRARWAAAPLTFADLKDLLEITGELEGLAATRATRLQDEVFQSLLSELKGIHADVLRLTTEDRSLRSRTVADLLSQFHCRLVEVAGGERLTSICHSLKPQATRYAYTYLPYLSSEIDAMAAHRSDLIEALEARKASKARRAVRAMFEHSARRYAEAIEAVGEIGVWQDRVR